MQTRNAFPDGVRVEDGPIATPDLPGVGFEDEAGLIRVMRELAD